MATLKEKIGYALGDAAAGGITWKIMSIAFPLFFTNVFGLTFADTAALMLIARMFDVVTDPIMGSLADRTQTRWGTYRPWLIFGAIPYGLVFALLLFTPDFGITAKRVWAYGFYILMMAMFRMVGAYAMGFITLFIFPYLQKMVGGSEQHQYAVLGAAFGLIACLMTMACGLLTKERIKPKRAESFSFRQFGDLFKNKPWCYITLVAVCTNFFNGFRYAVAGYMFTYCLGGDITMASLIINFTVFMGIGEATCMIFGGLSPAFTKWIGSKRMAFVWAAVICFATSVLYFFIPMDKAYIWVLIAISILTSVGAGLYSPLLWSMYADVADFATEKFGESSTGLIFSSGTMAQKFGGAISGSLIAMLLGMAGLVSTTDETTGETIVTITNEESVKTMVWALFSIFPAIMAALMGFLAYKFPLKK